jgi:hypothetical protein
VLVVHGAHSVYFGMLGEHGFVGLFLFFCLIASCFATTGWVVRWARLHGDELSAQYANMFRFALIGFLVSGLFLGRMYFDYFYTLVACIGVLKRVCAQRWSEMEQAEEIEEPLEAAELA